MADAVRTTRRSFLKRAGCVAGGIALAGVGAGVLGSRRPGFEPVSNSFAGASATAPRVLVTYATRCGSTGEIAEEIGKALASRGLAVDVLPLASVAGLEKYAAVVVGSAVRFGRWLPEATEFLRTRQAALAQVPTAIFTSHLFAIDDSEESRQHREAYTAPLQGLIAPRATAFFAGKMDFSRLSFIERLMSRAVKAPEVDRRDWAAIGKWAGELTEALGVGVAPGGR